MAIPPTDEAVTVTGTTFRQLEDGKAVETYSKDTFGLLQQLGAIPDPPRNIVRLQVGQTKRRLIDRWAKRSPFLCFRWNSRGF